MKEIYTMICEHVYNSILFVNEYLNTNGPAITITIALCKEASNNQLCFYCYLQKKKKFKYAGFYEFMLILLVQTTLTAYYKILIYYKIRIYIKMD